MQVSKCNTESCFLCSHSMPEWRDAIRVKKTTYSFKRGETIFAEGDAVKGIYFIYEGFVKVHKQWVDNKELIIRFAKAGDVLGHRALVDNDTYPISATALEDCKACFITNDFLEATFKTNPCFTYKMMQLYAAELKKAERRMRNLAHMEVKGRIAETLLEMQEIFGLNKEKFIALAITRQDIASYAGSTYETVFKFFTELLHDKIISTSGKSIKINNVKRLSEFVGN